MSEYQPKSNISTAYDQWSQTYDQDANRTRELAAARLRDSQLQLTGRHVVEVGCGTGYNTQWLARHATSVRALDFSPGMLSKARARVTTETVQFIEHDLTQPWPIADASADLIVVLLVLEHIENLAFFFSESARVLGPGGDLYLSELHPARQLAGRQAQFINPETGELVRVTAFLHNLSE
ncbi:MAG TPA: class I SAM-dependent methyltransferase, partial [Acidobacteriota bacterium]|nr:class I SAM-dependent methyltransferase [Acidobacteriota bacterium]